ncbi:hypothetical protein SAMN05421686_103142 [Thalassolituus maritimus]|uniref:Alginate export n=1 Tax=Thalassolituus maritimus TaxID=484498 RepID=A0A1N7KWV3_9GAMM|nr:hypothetical protein [Thalassolituus maritimus]SIS66122.1 hypothetical protein SAMN05421686_103142 [Thalassolituus maritimus]
MQAKKTLLAIALGTATLGASAYETEYGNAYADVKVRYESNDTEGGADAATALITDAAIGFETKDYEGFKALVEYEIVQPIIDEYAPEDTDYDTVMDPETREWNRAQVSYSKDGFGAVVGRQRIILDDARFVGNVGWRANEVTYDAATATFTKDDIKVFLGFVDQRNFLNGTAQDQSDILFNLGYTLGTGKVSAFAYLLENDDTEAKLDTYGAKYSGSSMADDIKIIYSGTVATQSTDDNDATYFALEGGAVVSGVTLALGNETLGSDDGEYGFMFPYGTNHKFNGWADKFLGTPDSGLSDTYVKAAGKTAGIKLVGFYHKFDAVEGSADLGSELDLLAVKKLDDTFTVGAKAAFYSAGDTGADTTKMWAWVQAKF